MSVAEEDIIKATGRANAPMEYWGRTTLPPRYHVTRFQMYRNCPNNTDPDIAKRAKRSIEEYPQINSYM